MHLATVRNSTHPLEHLSRTAEEMLQAVEISCPGFQENGVDLALDGRLLEPL